MLPQEPMDLQCVQLVRKKEPSRFYLGFIQQAEILMI